MRLRFPGYETTPIEDGVPKGWRITKIGELCTLTHQTVSPATLPATVPYIGLEHMPRNDFCLSTWGDSSDISSSKYVYHAGNIIFGVIRPYFHKVGFAINNGVVSSDSFVMEPLQAYWGLFLLTVSSNAFVEVISQTCKSGTKMPRADWKQMEKYPVLIAPDEIQTSFESIVRKITQEIQALAFQNKNLIKQRDLLLPRLMSGKLEV
ncbi:MAG: restriction endonuclease subunit S [Schwartzia sp.]|nr:restriction endonuclease subunit S [Schwartzia sp. (in: firmicutes)]